MCSNQNFASELHHRQLNLQGTMCTKAIVSALNVTRLKAVEPIIHFRHQNRHLNSTWLTHSNNILVFCPCDVARQHVRQFLVSHWSVWLTEYNVIVRSLLLQPCAWRCIIQLSQGHVRSSDHLFHASVQLKTLWPIEAGPLITAICQGCSLIFCIAKDEKPISSTFQ